MSEPVSTTIAKALQQGLETIAVDQGYFTDLGGNVRRGFLAHAIDATAAQFPLVALQPETETVEQLREDKAKISATYLLVVATRDSNNPSDELRACLSDIRRAFALDINTRIRAAGVNLDVVLESAEFDLPENSAFTVAAMSVQFQFVENYEA